MNGAVIAAILIPLLGAALQALAGRRSYRLHRAISLLATLGLCGAGVALVMGTRGGAVQVVNSGGWSFPLGITLVGDALSALMVAVCGLVGLAGALYLLGEKRTDLEARGLHPLLLILLGGVNGAFLTGDAFNLYVWFEVMLIASFVLLGLCGEKAAVEASVKYVVINLASSVLFLIALGLLYGKAGTLSFADLHVKLGTAEAAVGTQSAAVLMLVAFGIKAGAFPLFMWLPASYPALPAPLGAVFAGLLTKVGVYAIMRVFSLVFPVHADWLQPVLWWTAVLTMVVGVFGAASQMEIRRVLSFHIVSQIGYMLAGIALGTRAALAATVFYIVHHIVVKANLFFLGGVIENRCGSMALKRCGGLYAAAPWFGLLFLIPAMSLGGIPPLSGFFAKFALLREALRLGDGWLTLVALAVGLLTLYSMTKIWREAFWKSAPEGMPEPGPWPRLALLSCLLLAGVTVVISLHPQPLIEMAEQAAQSLVEPQIYVDAVMKGGAEP
jgi:multicomponent Na+:H+ antiporter subunit D